MPLVLFLAIISFAQDFSLNNMEPPKTELFYSQNLDTLYLNVTVPQGWHINSDKVPDDFLVPSSAEAEAKNMEFEPAIFPEPFKEFNEILNLELLLLQDSFTVKIPVKKNTGDINSTKVKFTYQACSNICLAPKTIDVFLTGTTSEKKNSNSETSVSDESGKNSFLLYIFLAIIGGFILNFMPCVLPIIFLKIFDLIKKHGEEKKHILKWGLATAGGIYFSFFVIAAVVAVVRLTGNAIGWGFQFQHPGYVAAMVLGLTVFALNLFGIFEIWMPGNVLNIWEKRSKQGGARGSFAYGILLVLLSTPCSAPFLGTAVGFAFSASVPELFAIFAAVAFGLSLPYLTLGIFPKWTAHLPRPGRWMVILKQLLGFLMMLTVIWLFWIFYREVGQDDSFVLAVLLLAAGFFAWLSRIFAKPGNAWWRFVLIWFVFVVICAFFIRFEAEEKTHKEIEDGWMIFSAERLDSLQNLGEAVWINGTADWCITCKVNEKAVFAQSENLFEEAHVARLRIDYTNSNEEALKFFEKYGRSGVPFDLLLTSTGDAILMSELLTKDAVKEALGKAY